MKKLLAITLALTLLLALTACGRDPRAVLIGNWTATQTAPYVTPYSFSMSITEDGIYTFDNSGESATGTWSGKSPSGSDLPDDQVWLSDPNLEFSTIYHFEVSDGGNTITLTATIGNWPVTTLTRAG
jgi:hypothetical protein